MKNSYLKFICVVLLLISTLISGCSRQAYPGPARDSSQISIIKGLSSFCRGDIQIVLLDGQYTGYSFEILPGYHEAELGIVGEPFYPLEDDVSPYAACMYLSTHKVSFSTQAGNTYWFYLDQSVHGKHTLSLRESIHPDEPISRQVPAEFTQLSFKRDCTFSDLYTRCL